MLPSRSTQCPRQAQRHPQLAGCRLDSHRRVAHQGCNDFAVRQVDQHVRNETEDFLKESLQGVDTFMKDMQKGLENPPKTEDIEWRDDNPWYGLEATLC